MLFQNVNCILLLHKNYNKMQRDALLHCKSNTFEWNYVIYSKRLRKCVQFAHC